MSSSIGNVINSGSEIGQLASTAMKGRGHTQRNDDVRDCCGVMSEKSDRFANAVFAALQQMGVPMNSPVSESSATPPNSPATSHPTAVDGTATTTPTENLGQVLKTFLNDLFDALHTVSNRIFSHEKTKDGEIDVDSARVAGAYGEFHAKMRDGHSIDIKLSVLIQQITVGDVDPTEHDPDIFAKLQQDFQNLLGTFGADGKDKTLPDFLKVIADNLRGSHHGLNVDAKA